MAFSWGTLEFIPLLSGLFATFAGVFLALFFDSAKTRRTRRLEREAQFAASIREILSVISDISVLRNGTSNGSLADAIKSSSAEAVRLNLPGPPLSVQPALHDHSVRQQGDMTRVMRGFRSLSNSRRLHSGLERVTGDDRDALVRLLSAAINQYAELSWSLRNIYLGTDEEFDPAIWQKKLEEVQRSNAITPFLSM